MKRNVAGQLVAAQLIAKADGENVTTGTTTVAIEVDGVAGTGGTATHIANGKWEFSPIQADTDGEHITFQFLNAAAVTALPQTYTNFPQSADNDTKLTTLISAVAGIPAAVWAVVTRTLTDKTGFSILGTKNVLDDLNDLSEAEITALFAGFLDSGVLVSGITIIDDDPIEVTRGDKKLVTITLGTQWPLTDKLVYFIIKKNQTDANSTAIVNRLASIIDAPNGIAQILLTSEEMAVVDCYHYEVELRRDPEDDQPETPKQGRWKINQDTRQ